MTIPTISHPAGGFLDYRLLWTAALDAEDTIASSTWEASDDDLEIGPDVFTDSDATVYLGGGTLGERYRVTNTIETAAGRTNVRSFNVEVTVL
jgi:hypothetical protein